jgi:hypothetical protein
MVEIIGIMVQEKLCRQIKKKKKKKKTICPLHRPQNLPLISIVFTRLNDTVNGMKKGNH